MTREQFLTKFDELVKENNYRFRVKATAILSSNAVDLESYEDDYRLPKIVLCAVLKSLSNDWSPLLPESKETLESIESII
jgi:hypothetical protein